MPSPDVLAELSRSKKNPISPLMAAKSKAMANEKVKFCPFGCEDRHLDEHSYCRHVIGVTLPGNPKLMEPMIQRPNGRRVIQVKLVQDPTQPVDTSGMGYGLVPQYDEVLDSDKLVRITTSYRVYRGSAGEQPVEKPADEIKQADMNTLLDMLTEMRQTVANQADEIKALKSQQDKPEGA